MQFYVEWMEPYVYIELLSFSPTKIHKYILKWCLLSETFALGSPKSEQLEVVHI